MSRLSQDDLIKKLKPAKIIIPMRIISDCHFLITGALIFPKGIDRKFIPSIENKNQIFFNLCLSHEIITSSFL
jgi:hypothetical protein